MYQEEGWGGGGGRGAHDQLVKITGQAREGRGKKSPERCRRDAEEPARNPARERATPSGHPCDD